MYKTGKNLYRYSLKFSLNSTLTFFSKLRPISIKKSIEKFDSNSDCFLESILIFVFCSGKYFSFDRIFFSILSVNSLFLPPLVIVCSWDFVVNFKISS